MKKRIFTVGIMVIMLLFCACGAKTDLDDANLEQHLDDKVSDMQGSISDIEKNEVIDYMDYANGSVRKFVGYHEIWTLKDMNLLDFVDEKYLSCCLNYNDENPDESVTIAFDNRIMLNGHEFAFGEEIHSFLEGANIEVIDKVEFQTFIDNTPTGIGVKEFECLLMRDGESYPVDISVYHDSETDKSFIKQISIKCDEEETIDAVLFRDFNLNEVTVNSIPEYLESFCRKDKYGNTRIEILAKESEFINIEMEFDKDTGKCRWLYVTSIYY